MTEENSKVDQKLIVHCEVCDKQMNFMGMKDGHPQFECPDCEYVVKITIKEEE